MKTDSRRCSSVAVRTFGVAIVALAGSNAAAQVQLSTSPYSVGLGTGGLTILAGSNASVVGSAAGNSLTSIYVGDIVTSLNGNQAPGVYNGFTAQGSIVPFTVGALPVRIGDASLHANFKLVATGGNGIGGGNDPVVSISIISRLCQQIANSPTPVSDPFLSAIEFSATYTQNGNGLQIIDETFGPATSGYIFTPGNYYLYQQLVINTSYQSNGGIQPSRGMTLEFGGDLTAGTYSGLSYTFNWQTVPTPGVLAPLAMGGLAMLRRRR